MATKITHYNQWYAGVNHRVTRWLKSDFARSNVQHRVEQTIPFVATSNHLRRDIGLVEFNDAHNPFHPWI